MVGDLTMDDLTMDKELLHERLRRVNEPPLVGRGRSDEPPGLRLLRYTARLGAGMPSVEGGPLRGCTLGAGEADRQPASGGEALNPRGPSALGGRTPAEAFRGVAAPGQQVA